MRELVYLSRRKLAQFQPARARGSFLRRVTGIGAKVPLAMAEVSLSFADETAKMAQRYGFMQVREDSF